VSASDEAATICEGTHERFVIDAEKFQARLAPRVGG
jgi:predicted thioesterase